MIEPKIKFDNVKVVFNSTNGQDIVFENLSFDIFAEEFACVLGASGSGKTTILRLVAGFFKPASGKVYFNSREIKRPDSSRTMVFQEYALFPWLNILDNVAFGLTTKNCSKKACREIALEYLNLVGLAKFKDYSINQISGGMRQRVALARALAVEPEVLLLDEPFGALDTQTRENLQNELIRIWTKTKRTVIFVTHSVDEALKLGDRLLIIGGRPGKLLFDTTVALSRPRNLSDPKLVDVRNKILEKIAEPEFFMGADI